MSGVAIVDTTVFLNVLDVPGCNQDRDTVMDQFEELVMSGANLLLPVAVVMETGNHIADLRSGGQRRNSARVFCDRVQEALDGTAPWVLTPLPDRRQVGTWLERFPDCAMRGLGMSDLSIIDTWEEACKRHRSRRVRIWSCDIHLQGYDRRP